MKEPDISVLKIFPWCIATPIAIKNPIVAKSPKGRTLLPNVSDPIAAIITVNGINNSPAEITFASPNNNAGSRPIRNSPPPNLLTIFLLQLLI